LGGGGVGGSEVGDRIGANLVELVAEGAGGFGCAARGDERGIGGESPASRGEPRAETGERDFESGVDFLRGGARPPTSLVVEFIEQHKSRFGVEPICVQLTELGCKFVPSTFYEARGRKPSKRAVRDEELKARIVDEHKRNYSVYGPRKMWMHLRRKDVDVARCTVERVMNIVGLQGARRGKVKRTTVAGAGAHRAKDLVGRDFAPLAPNRLWVADLTYVWTAAG